MSIITQITELFKEEAVAEQIDYWQPGNIYIVDGVNYVILLELDYDCEVLVFGKENGETQSGSYRYWTKFRDIKLVEVA